MRLSMVYFFKEPQERMNAEQSLESDFKVSWFLGEKKPREEEVACYLPIGRATRYRNLPSTT